MDTCIVLLSGGLDSTTVLAIANQKFSVHTLSFDYGQRHKFELESVKKIISYFKINNHKTIKIDLGQFGQSALTDNIDVPKNSEIGKEIPITYVPVRNTIFLSYALAYAEVNEIYDIFIGVNALDYSGYPDCRPEYIQSFEKMSNLANIIKKGNELGVDYSITHSCYDPSIDGLACKECDSCILRKKGFLEAEIPDPTVYQ